MLKASSWIRFRQVDRLATFHVGSALLEDEVRRKTEADPPIDRARAASPQASGVILEDRNLVAEESCDLGPCMRDQGLGFGEFQFEIFAQELPNLRLDNRL
jgi:hypothetical protein